jgi:hypothetical protein
MLREGCQLLMSGGWFGLGTGNMPPHRVHPELAHAEAPTLRSSKVDRQSEYLTRKQYAGDLTKGTLRSPFRDSSGLIIIAAIPFNKCYALLCSTQQPAPHGTIKIRI